MPPSGTTSLPSPLLSHGHLVEIDDGYTLIPLDQPTMLARFLRSSIGDADTNGPAAMNAELWWVVGTAPQSVPDVPRNPDTRELPRGPRAA